MSEQVAEPEFSPTELIQNAFTEQPEVIESPVADVTPPVETAPVASGHPAWQGILDQIPEVLRPNVLPQLQAWDKGVEDKIAGVHSQYSAYKEFMDNQVSAEQLLTANRLYEALDSDPKAFFEQLRDHYKFDSEQGQTAIEPELDLGEYATEDLSQNPLFKQQAEQLALMQEQFNAQQEAREAQEAELWLTTRQHSISESLTAKGIEVDWDYILPRAAAEAQRTNDYDKALDNASMAFEAMVVKYRTPVANISAPPVMTPNGSLPASSFNPNSLADEDRRKLMAQMLTQAFKG